MIIFFHTIGLFLLGGHWRQDFVFLTSYNLLLLMAVYLVCTESPKNKFTYILPVVLGFAIEVVGTNTGWPFGEYTYGSALGFPLELKYQQPRCNQSFQWPCQRYLTQL